mmetsp:Transcript_21812/g.66982  ORF Transcript_21812/g.66982 Transcript_21812/m.66982 type:complete len:206 (+) Transcript_21812:136-753(+)
MRCSWSRFARRCPLQQRPARRRRPPPFSRRPALPRRRASRRPCACPCPNTRGRRTACPTSRRARCGPARNKIGRSGGGRRARVCRVSRSRCAPYGASCRISVLARSTSHKRVLLLDRDHQLVFHTVAKRGRRGTSCRGAPPTRARPHRPEARRRFSAARTTRGACSRRVSGRTSPRALPSHSPSRRSPGARRSPAASRGSGSGSR